MTEIFNDIPDFIKQQLKYWVDLALQQKYPADTIRMIKEFRDSCYNEEEKEFVDFYFNMRLEALKEE